MIVFRKRVPSALLSVDQDRRPGRFMLYRLGKPPPASHGHGVSGQTHGDRAGPGPLSLVLGVGLVAPVRWLGLIGLTCLLLGYWFLVTAIPRGRRVRAVVPTLVGSVAVGGPLWVLWLGPLILP